MHVGVRGLVVAAALCLSATVSSQDRESRGPLAVVELGDGPGLHGEPPDLENLVEGDPVHTCDFRRVYADCLSWLGVDDKQVLGGAFETLGLLV